MTFCLPMAEQAGARHLVKVEKSMPGPSESSLDGKADMMTTPNMLETTNCPRNLTNCKTIPRNQKVSHRWAWWCGNYRKRRGFLSPHLFRKLFQIFRIIVGISDVFRYSPKISHPSGTEVTSWYWRVGFKRGFEASYFRLSYLANTTKWRPVCTCPNRCDEGQRILPQTTKYRSELSSWPWWSVQLISSVNDNCCAVFT